MSYEEKDFKDDLSELLEKVQDSDINAKDAVINFIASATAICLFVFDDQDVAKTRFNELSKEVWDLSIKAKDFLIKEQKQDIIEKVEEILQEKED